MKTALRMFPAIVCVWIVSSTLPAFSQEAYQFELMWGTQGTGDGQFNGPTGVAVDSSGNVYVADTENGRIQKFDSNGNFITKWGSGGAVTWWVQSYTSVATDSSGNVHVADPVNSRIEKFDSNGNLVWQKDIPRDGLFPGGIATDASGHIYLTVFRQTCFTLCPPYPPPGIQMFDTNGNFITAWGSVGTGDGQFAIYDSPRGIAVDSSGNVYVVDTANRRIQRFDTNGNFILDWGTGGTGEGQFDWPIGVAADHLGNIYVADTFNDRIQKFSPDGDFFTQWGSAGTKEGQFSVPFGVAVDSSGNVYVADSENHRIQKFSRTGPEIVSTPFPNGPGYGIAGANYTYSVSSSSEFGHPVEYQFDWGDGTSYSWSASTSIIKSWPFPGTYAVRAKARCAVDTTVESDWSEPLMVTITSDALPDLTGEWTSLIQTCANTRKGPKCRISGKFIIQNIGNVNAHSSFVRFYLSEDAVYDEEADIFLKQMATGVIRTRTSKVMRLIYNLPIGETAAGKYVIAVIDPDNTVEEIDESNNLVVFMPVQ